MTALNTRFDMIQTFMVPEKNLHYYKIYDIKKITILEKDNELLREINNKGIKCETDTILSLKGLEKECVLWSTRIPLESEKEVFEFSYTIVTRTSCLLIIALSDDTQNIYKKILGLLNIERLIMWDKETAENLTPSAKNITRKQ